MQNCILILVHYTYLPLLQSFHPLSHLYSVVCVREVVMRSLHTPSSHCDLELQNMPWCISVGLRGEKEKKTEERENQMND